MTPTEQDWSRRLRAHPRWTWMAGMREDSGDRVNRIEGDRIVYVDREEDVERCPDDGAYFGIPDLADPATLGCLWAMLREAYADIRYESDAHRIEAHWHDGDVHHMRWWDGATLGEALARAVLAAWGEA